MASSHRIGLQLALWTIGFTLIGFELAAQSNSPDEPAASEEGTESAESPATSDGAEKGAVEAMPEEASKEIPTGALGLPDGAGEEFVSQMRDFRRAYTRYAAEIGDYQVTVDAIVDAEYARRVAAVNAAYGQKIRNTEAAERTARVNAIGEFERFIEANPNAPQYTPDATFRLADLYFEKANDDYLLADEAYQVNLARYEEGELADPPVDPEKDYGDTIRTFRKLIDGWPDYRMLDGALYLTAYCELQMGNDTVGRNLLAEMIQARPDSRFVPEAWIRIGEYHFLYNELDYAKQAYLEAMKFPESKYFDKAMYKLAWTHYREDEFDQAIRLFQQLVEYSDELKKRTGNESVLRPEAIQYIAISLAEEDWDSPPDGVRDDDFGLIRVKHYITGDKPYEREVLTHLGNYLHENTRYADEVDIFRFILARYPLDRKNPEIHEKMILALLRDDNLPAAFEERGKLNEYYGPESDWFAYQRRIGNVEAVRYADKLVRENLIQSATWHHAEAQKVRNAGAVKEDDALLAEAREKYATAAQRYNEFLVRYPNDKDFYQWNFYFAECLYYSEQFEPAYQQYRVVREMNLRTNDYQEISAFNAVKALELRLKELVEQKELPPKVLPRGFDDVRETAEGQQAARGDDGDDQRTTFDPQALPKLVEKYVTAMDRYVVLGLKNPEDPALEAKFAFQSAKVFYDYDDFDTARERFSWIVDHFPEDEMAYFAGSLLLETYRRENDFDKLAMWAEKLASVIKGPQAEAVKAEVRTFRLGALFKSAEQLFSEKKYEAAAEEYQRLLAEDPETQYAAKALNNAGLSYEYVKRYESAMKLYKRVYREHPKDPLAALALHRVAVNQQRFFDFDNAVQSYILFYDKYRKKPQSDMDEAGLSSFNLKEKRGQALISAALLLENLQRYTDAAPAYEKFAKEYPAHEQAPTAAWTSVLVWKKTKQMKTFLKAIEKYIKGYGGDPENNDRVFQGLGWIADYHEGRGDTRKADKTYRRILDEYLRRNIEPGSNSAQYAAEAQFMFAERAYEKWANLDIKGKLKAQKKLLKQKVEGQQELTKKFEQVFEYQNIDWTMAANFRIGSLFQEFASSLYEVPIPFAEDSEEYEIYRTSLEDIAIPLEDEAIVRYEKTISVAREQKLVNDWTKKTLEQLNQYKPQEYPLYKQERRAMSSGSLTGQSLIPPSALVESPVGEAN
jgi:cellulose synthase operon protein C